MDDRDEKSAALRSQSPVLSPQSSRIDCRTLDEVRAQIDRIDGEIVALLAERAGYARQAGRFKPTAADVRAPARVEQVVARVRRLAAEHGAPPDLVERLYRTMIEDFTDMQLREKSDNTAEP